jgi:hypothetical protein
LKVFCRLERKHSAELEGHLTVEGGIVEFLEIRKIVFAIAIFDKRSDDVEDFECFREVI